MVKCGLGGRIRGGIKEGLADKFPTIQVIWNQTAFWNLVQVRILFEVLVGDGIQVIGMNYAAFAGCRDGKRANAGKDITDPMTCIKLPNHPIMLCMQPGVPVHIGKVHTESTATLLLQV